LFLKDSSSKNVSGESFLSNCPCFAETAQEKLFFAAALLFGYFPEPLKWTLDKKCELK
jgi:hypothetical protein